jgi:hypothetical protein
MSYLQDLLKRYSISNLKALILVTNLIYIVSILLKIFISNPGFFFENAFQLVNLFFYLYVVLSYIFIKNVKFYFLSSLFLILDLPVNLKPQLLNFLIRHFNIGNILGHQFVIHLVTLTILVVFIYFVFKFKALEYLQIFLLFFYTVSLVMIVFQTKRIYATPLQIADKVHTISKNYYFLLFDEYPSEQMIKKYALCSPADYPTTILSKEGFYEDQNIYSNFISTVRSTTTFLTGKFQSNYNVNNTIAAINNNVFTAGSNYSFSSYTIFDGENRPNSLFSRYYFYNFNNYLTQKIIPFVVSLFDKRGVGNYSNCEVYNADAVSRLDELSKATRPHVVYIHFFTPHYYPIVNGQPESQRIHNANQWMQKAINTLNKNDPKAGVIIFSDHGLRAQNIPFKLWNRNMLYYRNVAVDTSLVNKNGLVDLVKSIKY